MSDPMNETVKAELLVAARKAANRVAKNCWSISAEELHQEGAATALVMVRNYDPAKGPLAGYIYRGVTRHLINYVYDNGTCVSYKHRRTVLSEVRSVDLANAASLASEEDTYAAVEDAERGLAVRARVSYHAGDQAEAVLLCLLDDVTPVVAARKVGSSLLDVLSALGRVREALSEDEVLINLWSEA